jgi:MoxR-like ATPase
MAPMSLSILDRINHGWREVEPVVVGLMAMSKSFMLIGRHGTGKTRLARELSRGFGDKGFGFYDATKDDLISIAGIPDPDAIKAGRLRFIAHERSIWDKSTVVVDEITRAGKESQNLWLEILEERSCFGLPLAYRSIIATANPESYAAAFQLDEALLDRFHAVVPTPDHQEGVSADDVHTLITLASHGTPTPGPAELARVFADIQDAHASLITEGALDRISRYLGKLVPTLLNILREQKGPYLSPRTYARNLPETILAVAAYHRFAGVADPLRRAAVEALRYAVATKAQIKPAMLEQLHQAAEPMLGAGELPPAERIRLEIAGPATFEQRLDYVKEHWADLVKTLSADELEKVLGELLRGASKKGDQEKLVALKHALDELGYRGDALRQVDGRLLVVLNAAVNQLLPRLPRILDARPAGADRDRAAAAVEALRALVGAGTFLGNHTPEVRRLKTHLIDLREGDVAGDDDSLFGFFATLDLSGTAGTTP